jgi:signal transduction histidine kinase
MVRETTWDAPARRWLAAAIVAAVAMCCWLVWHAFDAATTLERLRESHARAALVHDSMLRLEAEIQRTAQLALATGDGEWLERHAAAESRLRQTIGELEATGVPSAGVLPAALAALDELSRLEQHASMLQVEGRGAEGLALVTGPEYVAQMAALGDAIRQFDDGYHGWVLSRSLGLTRDELVSLAGALVLFAGAIAAWVLLVRRLQWEKAALLHEMEARSVAEKELRRAQKMELLGQFAGGIAHDVDNTLSAVAGYSSLVRLAPDDRARARALEGLDRAVRQGRGLTSNLLSFVRQERARREPVELGAMIRDIQAWLEPLLPANIALEVRAEIDGELWVDADRVSLQQALVNLASNARDAMPEGGTLRVSLCRRDDPASGGEVTGVCTACIGVSDTGCGMDAETLARAREPLFSTKTDGRGTGLGLPSVERVLAALGGQLELESRPGAGTRVRMLLPAAAGSIARAEVRATARVVSPDTYAARLLADALEDAGLDASAGSRLDIGAPTSFRPAVIVLDWRRPPAEAVAALRGLRDEGLASPVILLLDPEETALDASLEEALTALAIIVSRSVPLGELGQLARRLAGAGNAVEAA